MPSSFAIAASSGRSKCECGQVDQGASAGMRGVICLLGLGVLLLCAPAQAEAVPAWLPPMDLVAAGQHALSPQA
ncbi:MAG: hypothetical protein M3Q31_19375, partial [Actinomycetota bacterium]|nr:hypothetical protein [Actinomycetota bacterium]